MAWLSGMTPPSDNPITSRAPSSIRKPVARPETTEHSENTTVEITMMILRRPALSDSQPTKIAASAQVSDSAEPSRPTCV